MKLARMIPALGLVRESHRYATKEAAVDVARVHGLNAWREAALIATAWRKTAAQASVLPGERTSESLASIRLFPSHPNAAWRHLRLGRLSHIRDIMGCLTQDKHARKILSEGSA